MGFFELLDQQLGFVLVLIKGGAQIISIKVLVCRRQATGRRTPSIEERASWILVCAAERARQGFAVWRVGTPCDLIRTAALAPLNAAITPAARCDLIVRCEDVPLVDESTPLRGWNISFLDDNFHKQYRRQVCGKVEMSSELSIKPAFSINNNPPNSDPSLPALSPPPTAILPPIADSARHVVHHHLQREYPLCDNAHSRGLSGKSSSRSDRSWLPGFCPALCV